MATRAPRNANSRTLGEKPGKIMSTKELADFFGVTVKSINNWRHEGMPLHGKNGNKYTYDSAACFRWRINYENRIVTRDLEARQVELDAEREAGEEQQMTALEAKTRKEIAQALMAELQLAQAREQVANINDLMDNFVEALVEVRAKLVSRSSRLAGILAYQDEEAIRELLDKDTADTLDALSEYQHEYVGEIDE